MPSRTLRSGLVLSFLAGCGGGGGGAYPTPNTAPIVVAGGGTDATCDLLDGPVAIDLLSAFDDAEDGDELTYALVTLDDESVATVEVDSVAKRLVWTPIGPGTARAVVRASDPDGLAAEDEVLLVVTATIVTMDLVAAADVTLYPDGVSANGAGDHVFAGTVGGSVPLPRRALLRFEFDSLPEEYLVLEASLHLEISRTPNGSLGATFTVHRLTRDFHEGSTDAQANEGSGSPVLAGDATWTHANWPAESWTTPGGDFSPVVSATDDPSVAGNSVVMTGAGLAEDVRLWQAGAAAHGWAILGDETQTRTVRRFISRTNPTENLRPRLRLRLAVRP